MQRIGQREEGEEWDRERRGRGGREGREVGWGRGGETNDGCERGPVEKCGFTRPEKT